jgi:hypothetical protein
MNILNEDNRISQLDYERTPEGVAVIGANRMGVAPEVQTSGAPKTNLSSHPYDLKLTCKDHATIVMGSCPKDGTMIAKRIYCGKEWCEVCGEKRSRYHNRKIARILPKAMQIEDMGYFVIEFPIRYRQLKGFAHSRKALDIASKRIVEVLAGKRMGKRGRVGGFFKRGLLRWHWFGDEMVGKWNPHANVLVDGAYIENWHPRNHPIAKALIKALHCPDLIIHYGYKPSPAEKFQCVEYITRATFRKYEWSPYMARELAPVYKYEPVKSVDKNGYISEELVSSLVHGGFRNQRWWGKWKDEAVWHMNADEECELLAANALESGRCPECDTHMDWTKPIRATWLDTWGAVEIGETGYYRIPKRQYEGGIMSPEAFIQLQRMKEEAKKKPTVDLFMSSALSLDDVKARIRSKHLDRMVFENSKKIAWSEFEQN